MTSKLRATTAYRLLLLLGVCLLFVSAPAATPVRAAIDKNQDIDNTLAEFDDGSLQMTSTASFPTGAPITGDQVGAVQLSPIAAINSVSTGASIPAGRIDSGVVAVGRNIFMIGGSVSNASSNTVIVSQIDLSTGGVGAWNSDPALPAVQHSSRVGFTATTTSARTLPAVASYVTGEDSGYIYVLGGAVTVGGNSISSYSVLRGTVANGRITSWNTADPMPNIPATVEGVQAASAYVAKLPNGKVYLYLVGGLQRFKEPALPVTSLGSKTIFYAEIDPATGKFVGNAWSATTYDLPLNGSDEGLWSSALVGDNFTTPDGQQSNTFYTLGGRTMTGSATFTSAIYRADINPSDGTLTVTNPSGAGSANASIGSARSGLAAVEFRGSVYVTGGVVGSTPQRDALSSYIQSDLRFPELGGQGSGQYFIRKDNILPAARAGHSMVVIPYPTLTSPTAYVYILGGTDGAASPSAQTNIYQTSIGDPSAINVSYPLEGYYVSKTVALAIAQAKLKQVFWATSMAAGTNVEISYRLSNDNDCSLLTKRNATEAPWTLLSATSVDGFQLSPSLDTAASNCFQYRARLTPKSDLSATPYLLRLGIIITIPGATDITPTSFALHRNLSNKVDGFAINLHNENIFLPGEPTLAADYGPDGPGTASGSFFVDVYIFPPGVTPVIPSIPTSPTDYSKVTINVQRSEIRAGPGGTGYDFVIPVTRPLCDYTIAFNQNTCTPLTIKQIFNNTPGTYKVVVVADGDNNVDEQPTDPGKAESNNILAPVTITVTQDDLDGATTPGNPTVALPIVVKP